MKALAVRALLHAGLWLAAWLALLAAARRPLLAFAGVAAAHALLLLVSRAKQRVLREPLVFADLGLYSQALLHPRLYLPYLGRGKALAAAALGVAVIAAGTTEAPVALPAALLAGGFVAAALLVAAGSALARGALTLDPGDDVARLGLLPALWLYALEERRASAPIESPYLRLRLHAAAAPIVVVQSESFFDVRRLAAGVPADVLANYDARAAEGDAGRLSVPVWGAYTMRTEFAFLSGIPPQALGVHRFNPYRRFARRSPATLASALKARGYRTLCLHPYAGRFFRRDRILPLLGFDAFVDAAGFAGARRDGPYVADAEVTARIVEELRRRDGPVFIFAITMENHGPLHLEGGDELDAYVRHLRNADAMIGELALALGREDGVLCFYGDHVPGLPRLYAAAGYDDPRTDYLIWSNTGFQRRRDERQAHELGMRTLQIAKLAESR